MTKFTDRGIKALKPKEQRYEIFEEGTPGFGIRVSPAGTKSWIFVYRRQGKLQRVTLGQHGQPPTKTLKAARAAYTQARADLLDPEKPAPAEAKRYRRSKELEDPTVRELAEDYLERWAKQKRSYEGDRRLLLGAKKRKVSSVVELWGDRKAAQIKRRDVLALLDSVVDRGSPIMANRTLACVRRMFNWAIERDILETSPCLRVKAPAKESSRQRVLSAGEIKTLWEVLESGKSKDDEPLTMTQPIRLALQLVLVTAQRVGEVAGASWEEFDLKRNWWTIPGERTKNGLVHRVPLSDMAVDLLTSIQKVTKGPYLFPSPRGTKSNEFRPILASAVSHAAGKDRDKFGLAHWTPHDLRRSAASHMTSVGVSRLVVSKLLNHVESGITAVYDRHSYDTEKKKALDQWARRLRAILQGKTDQKVVSMGGHHAE